MAAELGGFLDELPSLVELVLVGWGLVIWRRCFGFSLCFRGSGAEGLMLDIVEMRRRVGRIDLLTVKILAME